MTLSIYPSQKIVIFISLFWLVPILLHAQKQLNGNILMAANKQPVVGASIFFSNTTIGTLSDAQGNFSINSTADNYTRLVISCIGFETVVKDIDPKLASDTIRILMTQKEDELNNVFVEPYEIDNWEKWGQVFNSGFIGTMYFASACKLVNPSAIEFRYYKKKHLLRAVATETLEIENTALGYKIHYQLENFELDINARSLFYIGYPLFEEMQGNSRKMKKWAENRKVVYEGSVMHFMRSLFSKRLAENNFEVHRLERKYNTEKERVANILASKMLLPPSHLSKKATDKDTASARKLKDSLDYYAKIMQQPNASDVLDTNKLSSKNIAYHIDSTAVGFAFKNYLQVIYKKGEEPWEYNHSSTPSFQTSLLFLRSPAISVYPNGSYSNPKALFMLGFWAWNEKMATMLPLDYRLPNIGQQ